MFARRLAIGVRSSWLASATRWRCASTERSSASSVALKLRASRASSSLPAHLEPVGEVRVAGDRLGPAREARDRRERGAGDERRRARRRGRCRRRRRARAGRSRRRSERSTSVSGRATCTAPRVADADGEHAQVHAVDRRVAGRSAPCPPRRSAARARRPAALDVSPCRPACAVPSGATTWNEPAAPPNGTARRPPSRAPPPSGRARSARRAVGRRSTNAGRARAGRASICAAQRRAARHVGRRRRGRSPTSATAMPGDGGESRWRSVTARAARSRRRARCGSAAARRPPRACGAGSRRRRAARSRPGRSRSPRRGRRSGCAAARAAG